MNGSNRRTKKASVSIVTPFTSSLQEPLAMMRQVPDTVTGQLVDGAEADRALGLGVGELHVRLRARAAPV